MPRLTTLRIGGEQLAQVQVCDLREVPLQGLPFLELGAHGVLLVHTG